MRVRVTPSDIIRSETVPLQRAPSLDSPLEEIQDMGMDTVQSEHGPNFCNGTPESIDFSNGLLLTVLSYVIWGVIFIANAYAIVTLSVK